jgi:hypothetical protein
MLNRVSTSPAFVSLSAALGLDPDGEAPSQLTRPVMAHQESNVTAYSDHVIDLDDDDVGGIVVDAGDAPGSAQTATFPVLPAPPPIIGTPPGADKSKGLDNGPLRFQTISLAGDEPDTPPVPPADTPTFVDTPQFQAVDLETDNHGTPHVQPVDLDKTIAAGRVQSSSSDSWGASRQSTFSTMTTLSLGGKSVASSSAESTGASHGLEKRPIQTFVLR